MSKGMRLIIIKQGVERGNMFKLIGIGAFAITMLLVAVASVQVAAAYNESECAPEFIIEEREVEVGTEYEWQLQQWAFFKWVNNGQPVWAVEQPDTPGNSQFKRYVATGNERPIIEIQQVEVENPEYDPECGLDPYQNMTVAWRVPLTYTEYAALGFPTGNDANGAIWPQTLHATALTVGVDLDALDEIELPACSVFQIDTYDRAAGEALAAVGTLNWGDDHGSVISWKFLFNDNCEPEVTPTPEPTVEPTPTIVDEEPEPEPTETPEPTPTVVLPPALSSESVCIGNDLHTFNYEDGVVVSTEVAVNETECSEPTVTVEPPVIERPAAPIPAVTGHGPVEHR